MPILVFTVPPQRTWPGLTTANALGELLNYYQLNVIVQQFFTNMTGGCLVFLLVVFPDFWLAIPATLFPGLF